MTNNEWICDLCFPKAVEYGWLLPGYFIYKENPESKKFLIENGQGHGDDIFSFTDPCVDPGISASNVEFDTWLTYLQQWEDKFRISPREGFKLTYTAMCVGWSDKTGPLMWWLADRAAKLVLGAQLND